MLTTVIWAGLRWAVLLLGLLVVTHVAASSWPEVGLQLRRLGYLEFSVSSQAWTCSLSMRPLHLGAPCGLSSRVAIVFIGQLSALRSKSKTHALRFRPRTGTVSPSSCSVEKQVTDPAQIQGARTSKHHGYRETQVIGATSDTDHHATQQGYLTLCPFPAHVWRPLRAGAVSSQPVHCPT